MITFTRQQDGSYTRTGELDSRRAQIQIDGKRAYVDYPVAYAIALIEEAIAKGQVKAETYTVISSVSTATSTMSEEVKEKLAEINQAKKAERQVSITCFYESCEEQYPRTRGRYPQKFCPKHRTEKATEN